MDPNLAEAERNLNIAHRLLAAHDLVGAKRFADLAIDTSPQRYDDRPDQILAVADVLLASQKRLTHHQDDWYAILQLPRPSADSDPLPLVKRNYRRLSLLLHPDRNRFPNADSAFRLIRDAYAVLSDPAKRSLFDAELSKISDDDSIGGDPSVPSFWTTCIHCHHVFQYHRDYLSRALRCKNCRKAFRAAELPKPPSIVPGTNMYYATWGFFPMGLADGPPNYRPLVLMQQPPFGGDGGGGGPPQNTTTTTNNSSHQQLQQQQHPTPPQKKQQPAALQGGVGGPTWTSATGRNKKRPVRKKAAGGSGFKSGMLNLGNANPGQGEVDEGEGEGEEEEEGRGININEAARGEGGGRVGAEEIEMMIDLDSTDEMLGNLHSLPFLKDVGGINMSMGIGIGMGMGMNIGNHHPHPPHPHLHHPQPHHLHHPQPHHHHPYGRTGGV